MNTFQHFILATSILTAVLDAGVCAAAGSEADGLTSRDQLRMAAQQICPVSGRELGSMGRPLKVKIGEEELFLCCRSCGSGQVSPDHWRTIHANLAAAQGQCPVMKSPLPKNAKWTIVNGQIIYVCCPPCIDQIQADPRPHLAQVDEFYREALSVPSSDSLLVAAQQVCPVSGKKLGSQGNPVQAKVGDANLFLCCEECTQGKVNRKHWTTILGNLARAQGMCPVMKKQLPARPHHTTVEGRIVFVCCPPCSEKIAAEPKKHLAMIDGWYRDEMKKAPRKLRETN